MWKLLVRSVFVREENYQTEKIREFSSAISKTLDLNEILDKTISVMKELMDVGNIYICMQDAPGQPYRGVASDQPLNDLTFTMEEENPMIQWLKELKSRSFTGISVIPWSISRCGRVKNTGWIRRISVTVQG